MVFLHSEINKKSNQDTPDFDLSAVSLVVNSMQFCHANQNKQFSRNYRETPHIKSS